MYNAIVDMRVKLANRGLSVCVRILGPLLTQNRSWLFRSHHKNKAGIVNNAVEDSPVTVSELPGYRTIPRAFQMAFDILRTHVQSTRTNKKSSDGHERVS